MNLSQSYFELFQLPESYDVDSAALSCRYRELQMQLHPDRFADAPERDKRLSLQYASFVNEAFTTLDCPLKRAIYLLERRGCHVALESNTVMDGIFLMEQMELREALAEVEEQPDPEAALDVLRGRIDVRLTELRAQFASNWQASDQDHLNRASDAVRKMQFLDKLDQQAEQLEARLFD